MTSRKNIERRRSDVAGSTWRANTTNMNEPVVVAELPWGSLKAVPNMGVDFGMLPAKFSAQSLMLEFFAVFEKKITSICNDEPLDKALNRSSPLRRTDDVYLDNLLKTLNGVCEICLPSVLSALINWYEQQQKVSLTESGETRDRSVKRTLVASYLFCVVLVEILPQIHFHPTDCEQQVNFIISTAFNQISYRDPVVFGINYNNSLIVAETFAEVIGVLSQSHSKLVQRKFFEMLNDLRKEALTSVTVRNIISLLMGMKFFRIKTQTYADFETGVAFLDELGSYYLEVDLKQKDLKHALAGLLVEILLPVAAQIKTEANIPALISFVDRLYGPTYDLVNKKQHKMAAYPLLTCLLCISQSKFFLSSWVQFLNLTLANLKNKDPKISRIALESLYRLLWVYIIRNSCEGNTATRSRLESICGSLFPRGNRNVIPRDAPLNIFVKIIHFIAQQKLDFAFKEIIFDLLGCNRASRTISIYPERMNIGIRALMVIADSLQQKEPPPVMPRSIGPITSGTIQRAKKTYLTKPLTADIARTLGLEQYYMPCRKAFDAILRALDTQVGRPLMLTVAQTRGKEYEDIIAGDVRAKLDLLRTCLAAIPRLLPDPMSHQELIEMLIRMLTHIDEELRGSAYQTLQNLMTECVEWREEIVHSFLRFLTTTIQDTYPTLLESTVRFLLQLLCAWKIALNSEKKRENQENLPPGEILSSHNANLKNGSAYPTPPSSKQVVGSISESLPTHSNRNMASSFLGNSTAYALHCIEGFAIVLLCQIRSQMKKLAISLLKEAKQLLVHLCPEQFSESIISERHIRPVIEVLDDATPYVVTKYIEHVPLSERQNWSSDFSMACEKICNLETDSCLVNSDMGNEYMRWDPWACALSGYFEYRFLLAQCPTAVSFAWPALFNRLNACAQFVDPSNPQNENRGSLLRGSKSKSSSSTLCREALSQDSYLSLWQKYLVACFALAQPNTFQLPNSVNRSFSPNTSMETSDIVRNMAMTNSVRIIRSTSLNCTQLFQKVTNMLRWENMTDMRDSVVLGIGSTNPACFEMLLDELNNRGLLREAQDKKLESNLRRRKRKDLLRLQLIRVIEVAFFRGLLEFSSLVDQHSGCLSTILLDFIDSLRQNVELDSDRDMAILTSLRLHFAKSVTLLINGVSLDKRKNLIPSDMKHNIFFLFFSWCNRSSSNRKDYDVGVYVEQKAYKAMSALNCCGSVFESPKSLVDEENLYRWLETLVSSNNTNNDADETLCLILHLNDHYPQLFEWVIRICYTKPDTMASTCFRALAILFSKREYPCEFVSLFVLCQVFAQDPSDLVLQRTALQLLHILRRQFLDNVLSPCNASLSTLFAAEPAVSNNGQIAELEEAHLSPKRSKNDKNAKDKKQFSLNQSESVIRQLSKTYTQLTMPIFSEVCSRIENARSSRQASMLTFLLPWLGNIELVDQNCDISLPDGSTELHTFCGWGSEDATQLLLTNMLFLTAKLGDEHSIEMSNLWKCLATRFPSNLPIILHYLFIVISLAPDTVIPVAKKICRYLLNGCGDRLIGTLMDQLTNVGDPFKMHLVRCEMAPFFRWVPQQNPEIVDEFGTINIKDSNSEEEPIESANPQQPENNASYTTDASMQSTRTPKQLPMPPYGGHYARLLNYLLPPSTHVVSSFSRNNLTIILLCDLIGADTDHLINWSIYTPTILHMALINLDSHRSIVCSHSRRIMINICLLLASKNVNLAQIATVLINHQLTSGSESLERFSAIDTSFGISTNTESSSGVGGTDVPNLSPVSKHVEHYKQMLLHSNHVFSSPNELLIAIVHCLSFKSDTALWAHEEVTSRNWKLDSSEQLGCLARHIAEFLLEVEPALARKWTRVAINMALSTSSRHLAGRSFQVAGALCQSPSPFIVRILSRLVEVVGDPIDETQSYITDLMLCLQNLVQYLLIAPNRESVERATGNSGTSSGHSRSISYTPALLQQLSPQSQHTSPTNKKETRHSLLIENAAAVPPEVTTPLNRSKSATTLKLDGTSPLISEEEYTISINALCQLISISVAMLESSVDNEFLLALHLLDKILVAAGNEQTECFNRLEKTIKQLEWSNFPGIIGLASRGSVFHTGYEPAISILNKCVAFLNHPVVVTSNAIALIVTSVLPHCLLNFDAPTLLCCNAVQAISNYCTSKLVDALPKDSPLSSSDHPLHNLSTMMDQYSEHSFPRDRFQWAKCVVSYLVDAFNPNIVQIVVFLTEMLERSAPSMHNYLLNILNLFISYGDLSDSSPIPLNAQVIRVVSKHLQGNNSREASRILKCFVDQWNAISVNQVAQNELCSGEQRGKPTFDLYVAKPTSSSVPSPNGMANGCASAGTISAIETTTSPHTPRRSTVQLGMANQSDSLKRNMIQNRVRERLVSLLTASGLRAGLPKSSSVIFSQSTNDLNQLESAMASTNNMQVAGSASEYSSTERMSHQDDTLEAMSSRSSHIGGGVGTNAERASITTDSFPRVFREFDFLEAEHDSISESTDSCFNWLSTMRSPRCAVCHMDGEDENAGDEHDDDFLHPEDDYYEEDELGSNGGHSGAGSEGGKISREDRQEADDEPATLRSKVARHGGHRPFGIRPRRPLSRASKASDSNDISSDRTPIQSDKHSDESCPSCPVSEDEEDDVLGEEDEDELDQQRSGPSSPQKSKAKKRIRGDDSSSDLHRGQNEKVPPRNHQHQSIQQVRTPSLASSISPSQHRSLATTEDSIMETVSTIHSRSEYSAGNIMSPSSWAPLTTHRDKRMPIYLECNHHPSGRVEEMWNSVVSEIAVDQEGEMTSSGILLFSQLLRESCVKLSVLLRDASHLMAMPSNQSFQIQSPYHNEKTAYLNHALNVVLIVADCPFLFVTPQFLRSSNLLQTQKFRLYELREHFETFSERREQCIQALNSLKSSMKLHSLGGAMAGESLSVSAIASFSNSGQEVELCKCLHKLFFQLLLMLEKLNEMIQAIQQSSNSQEYDLSPAVACLHRDLLGSLSEVPTSRNESRAPLTPLRGSDRHSADSLVLHLTNKHYKNALMNVRHLRSQYGSEFGCCDHMDIEVLLLCFCRSHTLRTWAIVGHLQSLQQSCAHLKETNMQLASLLRMLTVASSAQSNSTQSESGNSGGNQPLSASMSLGTAGGRSTSRLFSTGGASSSTTLADIGGVSGGPTPAAGSTIFGSPTSN